MDNRNCVMTDQYRRIQGAKLKVQNKTISVYKGVNTVGRNKTAIVNLKNLNISQHHALIIIVDDTQHFISDLNSSNGTYLLDTKLAPFKLYELSNDMEIKFGDEVASYLKMPNLSTTVHLETETMEMTQNVTQNFYAATTQLICDNSSFNQTRLSNLPRESISNRESQDIHEAATQVVFYPQKITNINVEIVNDDIHEAPTQIFTPQPSTSKASQDIINVEEDIHEMATQVVVFPSKKDCDSSSKKNEEKLPEINKNIDEAAAPIDKSNNCKELNDGHSNLDDTFMNNQNLADLESSAFQESIIEATVMEEKEENMGTVGNEVVVNGDSNDSVDFLTMQEPCDAEVAQFNDNANVTDDKSTTSESQGIEQPKRRIPRKLSSSDDLSESQNKPKICNSDSDTDIDDTDNIENVKTETSLKLSSEAQTNNKACNSDSDTDIEEELSKPNKKRLKSIPSDSETDIEDEVLHNLNLTQSEDIVKPKVLAKKTLFNSDSETEVEDDKDRDPVLEAVEDADSNATEILNDTDCIPATQDAFADMFQYKHTKLSHSTHSQNQSSEESFKLGLTELMSDGENNLSTNEQLPKDESNSLNQKQISNSSNTGEKKGEDLFVTSKQKSNEKVESVMTDEPTQELMPENVSDSTKMTGIGSKNTDDLYMAATQKIEDEAKPESGTSGIVTNVEKNADEDLYLMPTQKINEDVLVPMKMTELHNIPSTSKVVNNTEKEADEDLYMMPTQKINDGGFKTPVKKFTFKKKATNLEGSLTNILSSKEEEDPYLMATQKINETEGNDDDIYMQPTQKLENNSQNSQKTQSGSTDMKNILYMQPTQDLNSVGPKSKEDQMEEDLYMAPTQPINQNSINTLYMLETQKINSESHLADAKTSRNEQIKNDDIYNLPTQPLSHTHEAGGETLHGPEEPMRKLLANEGEIEILTSAKRLVVTNQDSPRRKKLKKSDIENLKRIIESNEKIDDAETLSQIDAFVKKPLEKCETEDSGWVETLSQIEAFVKKPFENASNHKENAGQSKILDDQVKSIGKSEKEALMKSPSNTSLPKKFLPSKKIISIKHNEEEIERPETLSQIQAFVEKPLDEKFAQTSTNPSEEDLYLAPTQELHQDLIDDDIGNKSEESYKAPGGLIASRELSNTELYMLETQKVDSQQDILEAGKIPQNNKRSSPLAVSHGESITSAKSSEVLDLDVPKSKRIKESDTVDLTKDDDAEEIERPETLSQIEAFIKKPLDIGTSKSRKLPKIEETPNSSGEKNNQIKDTIKQSGKSKNDGEFEKPEISSRVSKTRHSTRLFNEENKQEISKLSSMDQTKPQKPNEASTGKLEVTEVNHDKNLSTSSADSDTVRSDIDQSFALLEARSTKTRKSNRITSVGEIKVAACKNRRSMTTSSIPDFSKREAIELRPTTRKSKKVSVSNNLVVPEIKVTDGTRRTIGEGIAAKRKSDSSDSDFLENEIPNKKAKISVLTKGKRKPSVAEGIDNASSTTEERNRETMFKISKTDDGKKDKGMATDDTDKLSINSEESNREVSSKTLRTSVARKGKGKATVVDDIVKAFTTNEGNNKASDTRRGKGKVTVANDTDEASTTSEENNRVVSSVTPRASVVRRGKAKTTVADDIDVASTSKEINNEVPSKTPKTSDTRKGKGKAIVADDIDKASTTSEENNREVSSKTPRGGVTRKGKRTTSVTDDTNKALSSSEESNREVSSKTPRATIARKGKGKAMVTDDVDKMSTASEESNRGKEPATPSTSRARASSRLTISKNSDDNRSGESESAQDPSMATPSRRGRKTVPDDALFVSPERSKRKQRPKVVFTMLDNPQLESIIRHLGGSVVDTVDSSTVLVTEHVKRSQKLLTAVGQGKPICSPSWIRASKKANEFLDPWEFILTDKEAESKWSFSLKESISKAANEKLLTNYSFQLLVNNATDVLKGAIESCGGKCVTRNPPKNAEGFYVVVASPENRSKYLKIKKQNPEVIVVEPEAIFDGVLRQELRLGRHLLT